MKASTLLAIGLAWLTVTLGSSAHAGEQEAIQPAASQAPSVDCSKETWPNFSSSCLRNAGSTVAVRIVTATRR